MQNDMRDRLIDLLYEAEGQVNNDYPTVEQIADHLIANGVIVPPCKVGDTVYYLDRVFREVDKCKVYGFTVVNGKLALLVDNGEYKYVTTKWCNTKAQAEQKLKELRADNG